MNKKYFLLDTNSLSSLTKSQDTHHEKLISKLDALNDDVELYASIISLYEMEYGAFHAKEPELIQEAREAIQYIKDADENEDENRIKLCNLTKKGAKIFGEIKEQFQKKKEEIGEKIGKRSLPKHNVDLIIAATAIELEATLISNDKKMFELLQNIQSDFKWEDWTK
jgi:predicted nucleic acid-binding protein